jgi:hypothetical protein
VSTKEKNRKNGGRGTEKPGARPESEQAKEKEERVDDEIVREFLVESNENLDRLDRELVNLEKDPGDQCHAGDREGLPRPSELTISVNTAG